MAGPLLLAGLAVVAVCGFDPFGWDRFGPLRWAVLPALGFAVVGLWIESTNTSPLGIGPIALSRLWAVLLGWGLIATVTAADPVHAWIGTPDRRFGWLTWLLCGGLFIVCGGATGDRRDTIAAAVAKAVAVAGIGLGVYTGAELAGLGFDIEFANNRAGGPFGQPAYLGAAAVLVAPIGIGVAAGNRFRSRWWWVGVAGAFGGVLALLASQSRAAWLGGLVAGVTWLVARRGQERGERRWKPPAVAALAAVPLVAIVAVPALRSRLTTSVGETGVVRGRVDEWQVGLRAVADAPLLGYGPEGYRTVFGRHVDQQYTVDWGREVITDRAHAGLLDVALAFGIPGGLAYLALAVAVGVAAIRVLGDGPPIGAGIGAATVGYLVQQQFFFPLSELDPLFWILAGLTVGAKTDSYTGASEAAPVGGGAMRPIARGVALGLAGVALVAGMADMAANITVRRELDRPPTEARSVDTAISLRPDSVRYRFIASRLAGQAGDLDRAIDHIEQGLTRSSDDPALRGEHGRLLLEQARAAPAGPGRAAALDAAVSTLSGLVADDPNHPEHRQRLGIALALTDDLDGALTQMQRAVELAPDRPEPVQNLEEIERLQRNRN